VIWIGLRPWLVLKKALIQTLRTNGGPVSTIPTRLYYQAANELLQKAGFLTRSVAPGKILITKSGQTLYVDIAGKNLPYHGRNGLPCFEWETWIAPDRLERLEVNAASYGAEPWLAFCYAVLEQKYERHFAKIGVIANQRFGLKLISAQEYRDRMVPRSPSWGEVNLPRERVTQLTLDPAMV